MKKSARYYINLGSLILFSMSLHADATDTEWEQQLSARLVENNKDSEVVWLSAANDNFLGLFNVQTSRKKKGVAIILHAMGGHADWPRVITPLRVNLPEHGWDTLSIQLPVLSPGKKVEDYGKSLNRAIQRIGTSVEYLIEKQPENIVIIGYGYGATNALAFLESKGNHDVKALVVIGLQDYPFIKPAINVLDLIESTDIPLLDIYGSNDFMDVIKQVPDRRLAAIKGKNQNYTQLQIDNANHYFNDRENILIQSIVVWLDKIMSDSLVGATNNFDDAGAENIVIEQ